MTTALITSLVLSVIVLVLMESIKRLISTYFSNLGKNQVSLLYLALLLVCFAAPFGIEGLLEPPAPETVEEEPVQPSAPKTKDELIAKGIEDGVAKVEEYVDNNRTRDSIFKANRDEFWVYQIGHIKKGDSAWELYQKIKDNPGVCFFKEGRKKYRVVIYGYSA